MKKLYVGNLSFRTTEDELRDLFAEHGEVANINIITDRESGRSRGFGFVEMEDGADAAIEALDGNEFQERSLKVNVAKDKESGGGRGGFNDRRGGGNGRGRSGGGGFNRGGNNRGGGGGFRSGNR